MEYSFFIEKGKDKAEIQQHMDTSLKYESITG